MPSKISILKSWSGTPDFDTMIPTVSDAANIEDAFKLFLYGTTNAGSSLGEDASLYNNLLTIKTTADTAASDILSHAHGTEGGAIVGTINTQTLLNKTLSSPIISGTVVGSGGFTLSSLTGNLITLSGLFTASAATIAFGTNSSAITANSKTVTATQIGHLSSLTSDLQPLLDSKVTSYSSNTLKSTGSKIFIQSASVVPTGASAGDIWFQI